ncbi:MAG: hypothetical protein U0136_02535 [Bdellovibrionota bacterium]
MKRNRPPFVTSALRVVPAALRRGVESVRSAAVALTAGALVVGASLAIQPVSAHADEIESALSGRHFASTSEQLEKIAGNRDALVKRLLELRTQDEPPFVGLRAEKLLLSYVDEDAVLSALESDLSNPKFAGLAQMIAIHVDQVGQPEARLRLARGILARAKSDSTFRTYADSLKSSSDPAVSRVAREVLDGR